jgi:5-carboxymethyl-2-hydroxymuconate isomerase
MIVAMIDANHISERVASLKLEISDLRVANTRYWSRQEHTALDKKASALREQRLIQIKLELADMSRRCA